MVVAVTAMMVVVVVVQRIVLIRSLLMTSTLKALMKNGVFDIVNTFGMVIVKVQISISVL